MFVKHSVEAGDGESDIRARFTLGLLSGRSTTFDLSLAGRVHSSSGQQLVGTGHLSRAVNDVAARRPVCRHSGRPRSRVRRCWQHHR